MTISKSQSLKLITLTILNMISRTCCIADYERSLTISKHSITNRPARSHSQNRRSKALHIISCLFTVNSINPGFKTKARSTCAGIHQNDFFLIDIFCKIFETLWRLNTGFRIPDDCKRAVIIRSHKPVAAEFFFKTVCYHVCIGRLKCFEYTALCSLFCKVVIQS